MLGHNTTCPFLFLNQVVGLGASLEVMPGDQVPGSVGLSCQESEVFLESTYPGFLLT